MNSQTKELATNTTIASLFIFLAILGYFIFLGGEDNKLKQAITRAQDAATGEVVKTGAEVANTITELRVLKSAVMETTQLFNSNAFSNLRDFSAPVPHEAIGRENPFVPTEWKLRAIAAEERARRAARGSAGL